MPGPFEYPVRQPRPRPPGPDYFAHEKVDYKLGVPHNCGMAGGQVAREWELVPIQQAVFDAANRAAGFMCHRNVSRPDKPWLDKRRDELSRRYPHPPIVRKH